MNEGQLKTESITIDGLEYSTTQLPAMRAFGLLARLVKLLGPTMVSALGSVSSLADLMSLDLGELAPALGDALAKLDPDEMQRLVPRILEGTSAVVEGPRGHQRKQLSDQPSIDAVFSGRVMTMLRVMAHAVRTNFQDFSAGSLLAAAQLPGPSGG